MMWHDFTAIPEKHKPPSVSRCFNPEPQLTAKKTPPHSTLEREIKITPPPFPKLLHSPTLFRPNMPEIDLEKMMFDSTRQFVTTHMQLSTAVAGSCRGRGNPRSAWRKRQAQGSLPSHSAADARGPSGRPLHSPGPSSPPCWALCF